MLHLMIVTAVKKVYLNKVKSGEDAVTHDYKISVIASTIQKTHLLRIIKHHRQSLKTCEGTTRLKYSIILRVEAALNKTFPS